MPIEQLEFPGPDNYKAIMFEKVFPDHIEYSLLIKGKQVGISLKSIRLDKALDEAKIHYKLNREEIYH